MIEREAQAACEQRDAELVEAHALPLGLRCELAVQGGGESKEELAAGFHAANSTACDIDNGGTGGDTGDMLIDTVLRAARNLEKNEALFLPTECLIARSSTGKLRFGSGTHGQPTWHQGDGEALLTEHLAAMLDHTQTGYFAQRYRNEFRVESTLRPVKVAAIGRRNFHVVYEPTDAAFDAMMCLDGCDWFEHEGRPYGAAECWTSDGRHLWVTATGEMRAPATEGTQQPEEGR